MEEKPACACYHLEESMIADPELAWCKEHHGEYGLLIYELKRLSRFWRLEELRCEREARRLKERGESTRALAKGLTARVYHIAWVRIEGALAAAPNTTKCAGEGG